MQGIFSQFQKLRLNLRQVLKFIGLTQLIFTLYLVFFIWDYFYWKWFYDLVYFYFDSPFVDFKKWFPRFYLGVYVAVIIIKLATVAFFAWLVFFLFRKRSFFKKLVDYNGQTSFLPFVMIEGGIVVAVLCYYLAIYFIAKHFAHSINFMQVQLLIAHLFLLHLVLQIVCVSLGRFEQIKAYLKRYILEPALPYNLAILRIVFFLYLINIYSAKLSTMLPTVSLSTKVALPYIGWLIDIVPVSADIYTYACYVGIVTALMVALGLGTRVFLIINAVACFYIMAVPNFFGKLWHEQLVIWISWFFALSRCYDVFSIDALIKRYPVAKRPEYTYPVRLFWIQLGVIYFWAGYYKLWDTGFDWALSQAMINQVQLEWVQNYDQIPGLRIDHYPTLLHLAGLGAILFELSYPIWVLHRHLRWIAAVAGLAMHNTIGYFMYISFSSLLQVFYLAFIDFNVLFRKKDSKAPAFTALSFGKTSLVICISIIILNCLCGMLSINTYPFSAYPKYSARIEDSLKIINFQCRHNPVDIFETGKRNDFRWESYGWLEYNLIRNYEEGENVNAQLKDYWQIWQNHNPELCNCDTVDAWLVVRPVAPEGRFKKKTISQMGTIIKPELP